MTAVKPVPRRRGVTLLEMLVVVALVVLMMMILVQIFQAALGAISVSRTYQELSNSLRMLDQTIRSDLSGVTARMTPPLDPGDKLGYFELGENAPADLQGEDLDDYLAFTAKAPEGRSFTGRVWIAGNPSIQPTTVSSQFAEIFYFVRNGNLYRRVLLVAPERKNSIQPGTMGAGNLSGANYPGFLFNVPAMQVSWQGMNDVSARPANVAFSGTPQPPTPNDLGDLTERHNRSFHPRFTADYYDSQPFSGTNTQYVPDGVADDNNLDDVPDYYPTLYPNLLSGWQGAPFNEQSGYGNRPRVVGGQATGRQLYDVLAFPYVNPAMYSKPDSSTVSTANGNFGNDVLGWIHSPDPSGRTFNHGPLTDGDSLAFPNPVPVAQRSTWFGFPLWSETVAGARGAALPGWTDPVQRLGTTYQQSWGLRPFVPGSLPAPNDFNFPPPQRDPFALTNLFEADSAGSVNLVPSIPALPPSLSPDNNPARGVVWADDLIMTGVRSFDVKVYDPDAAVYNRPANAIVYSAGYHDLGYAGNRDANGASFLAAGYPTSNMLMDTPSLGRRQPIPVLPYFPLQDSNFNPIGFGHEGRIPPLVADNRVNPSRPYRNAVMPGYTALSEPNNVGDDSSSVIRLRHVFDTWSTTYTKAPTTDLNFNGSAFQPYPNDLPVYPSYPPPYASPLRGIQIQIRVVDPRDERVKILTLRHDFSDKL